jgi:hypothetical protein
VVASEGRGLSAVGSCLEDVEYLWGCLFDVAWPGALISAVEVAGNSTFPERMVSACAGISGIDRPEVLAGVIRESGVGGFWTEGEGLLGCCGITDLRAASAGCRTVSSANSTCGRIFASPGGVLVLPSASPSESLSIRNLCTECVEACGVSVGPLLESMEWNDCVPVAEDVSAYERAASFRDIVDPCLTGRKCSMGAVCGSAEGLEMV